MSIPLRLFFTVALLSCVLASTPALAANGSAAPASQRSTVEFSTLSDSQLLAALDGVPRRRTSLEQDLALGRAACYQRFAVNDCIMRLRTRNREAFDALRQEEIALQDEQRQRQSKARVALVAQKKEALEAQKKIDAQRLPQVMAQQAAKVEEKKAQKQTLDAAAQARLLSQKERLRLAELKMQEYERKLKERAASGKARAPSLGIPLRLR